MINHYYPHSPSMSCIVAIFFTNIAMACYGSLLLLIVGSPNDSEAGSNHSKDNQQLIHGSHINHDYLTIPINYIQFYILTQPLHTVTINYLSDGCPGTSLSIHHLHGSTSNHQQPPAAFPRRPPRVAATALGILRRVSRGAGRSPLTASWRYGAPCCRRLANLEVEKQIVL